LGVRGSSLITEGAWPQYRSASPPSRKRVRTRSQLVHSWRSQGRKIEDPNWRLRTWSPPLLWSCAPPPSPHLPPGSRSAAAVLVPPGADGPEVKVGGWGPPPAAESPRLSYPPRSPRVAPTANSRAAKRGPRAGRGRGVDARLGTSGGGGGGEGGARPPPLLAYSDPAYIAGRGPSARLLTVAHGPLRRRCKSAQLPACCAPTQWEGNQGLVQPSATASRQHQDGSQRSADQLSHLQCLSCPVWRSCPPDEVRASAGAARPAAGPTGGPEPETSGAPQSVSPGGEDVVLHSESSSLSESGASHDNEEPRSCFPLAERPSPPKAWDQLRTVSGGSPERRTPWKPPPSDLYGDLKSRRNSVASPTRPEGLHSRQWSGSQDSQMGFPRADLASDRASLFAARTRRSNSSEALLVDRAAGGGAGSPPAPLAPPAAGPPVCKSSEVLYERPQPTPAFSSRTSGPPDPPRAARPSSAAPASRGAPRLPPVCGDFLLDYSLDRGLPRSGGGAGWGELLPAAEVPGPLSRRDGLLTMLPGPPPVYAADGSSPLLRSKDPHTRATRTKPCGLPLEATEGPEVHPNPLLWMPPPTRIPPAGERSGHKNLALEGLRDWYIRNSGLAAGPQRRPVPPHMGPQHPPFLHARCYEVGQALYGAPSQAPLPHSRSFTAPPVSGRYGGCFY
uniref:Coiled-coil domain containing 120 n=1 Tax=Felis catus TaxID=9685 RepID=A0ABI7W3E1_FELCA